MTSSIQIVGESQTFTSGEVLVRSLFEYNPTINNVVTSCMVLDLVK